MKTTLEITMFGKWLSTYGTYRIWYVSKTRKLYYTNFTTDAKLIDKTFNCENPTQKSLRELRKACKK